MSYHGTPNTKVLLVNALFVKLNWKPEFMFDKTKSRIYKNGGQVNFPETSDNVCMMENTIYPQNFKYLSYNTFRTSKSRELEHGVQVEVL